MGKRVEYMDAAKGIGILAVVIAHIDIDMLHGKNLFDIALYTFHLPLFFLISGYFFSCRGDFKSFALKKSRAYLIPYAFAAVVITVFELFAQCVISHRPILEVGSYLLGGFIMQRRFTTLWFLAALFVSELVFWALIRLLGDNARRLLAACAALGTLGILYNEFVRVFLPWNLDVVPVILLYLAIGYTCRKRNVMTMLIEHRGRNMIVAVAASVACSLINYRLCGEPYEMFAGQYGVFPLTIMAACCGSVAVILFMSLVRCRPLNWLGRNTMVFFMFHQSIAMPVAIKVLAVPPFSVSSSLVGRFVTFLIVMSICCMIHAVVVLSHCGALIGRTNTRAVGRHR
ncbi:acyltransferase family protein [Bifidobacterium vansinderenii]|uniref:Acyltransferase 3 n=1 Tax=Bifidobacterium vansinderenii TaxID=1984871 RepID=A0A229VZY4_9BIFI|nr:acyltransferase family protein [Bifidobacterium vansinderenii]OXN01184.1 acyltransferase 3 [Bifidobacterium vansinderenii]